MRDDYGEEYQGRSFQSGKKCRYCGRYGCEGGPACDYAAEARDEAEYQRMLREE